MLRELPQFQGISHAQKLSTEEERGLMQLYQEAPGRRGTERAGDYPQGRVVNCV